MSEENINKEQVFKNQASSLEVDVDTDALWAAVETELPPTQKRRRGIIWWWTGLAALLVGGLLWRFVIINAGDNGKNTTKREEVAQIENNPSEAGSNRKTKEGIKSEKHLPENKIVSVSTTQDQMITPKVTTNENKIKSRVVLPLKRKDSYAKLETVINSQEITIKNEPLGKKIPLPIITTLGLSELDFNPKKELLNIDLNVECKKRNNWFFVLKSGVNQNWSQINQSNSESANDIRFDHETDVYGFGTGILGGLQKGKWSVALGGNYSMQAALFQQKETIITQREITGHQVTFISTTGVKNNQQGAITETTVAKADVQWHRIHQSVNLELEIGRTLLSRGRWSVNGYAGVGYNIWSKHQGYYLEAGQQSITKFTNETTAPYKKRGGVTYNGAIGVDYNFGKLKIGIAPYINYSNYSILENTFYKLKNSHYGIQLRMMYRP